MNPTLSLFTEPPSGLSSRILAQITRHEERRRRVRFVLSCGVFLLSVFGMRVVFGWLMEDMAQSGFGEYISLLFVDVSVLTQSGQEFMLALLETMPALSMSSGGVLLIVGAISGWSVVKVGRLSLRMRQFSHE